MIKESEMLLKALKIYTHKDGFRLSLLWRLGSLKGFEKYRPTKEIVGEYLNG